MKSIKIWCDVEATGKKKTGLGFEIKPDAKEAEIRKAFRDIENALVKYLIGARPN